MNTKNIAKAVAATALIGSALANGQASAADFPKTVALPSTVTRNAATPLGGADAAAVHELLNRVYLAEDTRDAEALRQAVTKGFVQNHVVFGRLEGRDAFADWVIKNPQFFDGLRHQAANVATRSTGKNAAEAVSYIQVFQVYAGDEKTAAVLPRLVGHGVVKDRLVKENGRWLLSSRTYDQFSILSDYVPDAAMRARVRVTAGLE